jgi:hypothetical protein
MHIQVVGQKLAEGEARAGRVDSIDTSIRRGYSNSIREVDPVNDILTVAEMQSRFDSEWLLIEEPETDAALQVQAGRVRWHSKDRDEIYRKAVELRPQRFAVLYTGTVPAEGTAIVL